MAKLCRLVMLLLSALVFVSCQGLSPLETQLIGTWTMPSFTMTDYEESGPKTTVSEEMVEITFTRDHIYLEGIRGQPPLVRGRWRLEGHDLITMIEEQPVGENIPKQQRETIARIDDKEIVFSDGTSEGKWARVR